MSTLHDIWLMAWAQLQRPPAVVSMRQSLWALDSPCQACGGTESHGQSQPVRFPFLKASTLVRIYQWMTEGQFVDSGFTIVIIDSCDICGKKCGKIEVCLRIWSSMPFGTGHQESRVGNFYSALWVILSTFPWSNPFNTELDPE